MQTTASSPKNTNIESFLDFKTFAATSKPKTKKITSSKNTATRSDPISDSLAARVKAGDLTSVISKSEAKTQKIYFPKFF